MARGRPAQFQAVEAASRSATTEALLRACEALRARTRPPADLSAIPGQALAVFSMRRGSLFGDTLARALRDHPFQGVLARSVFTLGFTAHRP